VNTFRIIYANLTEAESTAEASEPFPLNERQKNVNDGSARNDGQSGFAEYDRGFKDGREHACSLLKSIGLFEFEPPNGNRITWLRQAIEKNSVQAVELLLDMGTKINQESPLEDSKATTSLPLFQAAESRCSDIVKLLLERGANVHGRNSSGWTVLHAAAKGGDVSTIQLLLKQYNVGIEVRSEGEKDKGFTPLMIAVEHGKDAAIRHLKRGKANIKATDDTGQGLLHLAVNRKDLKTMQLLVDLGVQTGAVDDTRNTPLHRAATKGYEEIAGFLIKETPGLVNSENQDRETLLHSAAKAGRVNILELLLQNGARVDLPNNKGATALHLAVRNGHAQAVERLLKNNAGPNARDASDRAPLHTAIWFGKNAMITLLLDNNADINQVGNFGMPPLHLAAWVQDFVAVQELFERGASPSTRIKINGKGEEKTAKGVLLSIAPGKRKSDSQRINKLLLDATNRRTSIAAQKQER
jgi:ankyrin repeat protein